MSLSLRQKAHKRDVAITTVKTVSLVFATKNC